MTCSQADEGCPFIAGAETRIPITYEDPKISDHTPEQTQVYAERSLQIAAEMLYVFSGLKLILRACLNFIANTLRQAQSDIARSRYLPFRSVRLSLSKSNILNQNLNRL
jgi:hypothetical protein